MEKYLKPVKKKCLENILKQMNKSIYRVNEKNGKFGIGLFSFVKIKNEKIPVLITSYQFINEYHLQFEKRIKISINNKIEEIEIGNSKYMNKEFDITIIEITKSYIFKKINFLELDDMLYINESEMYYNKESIYIIHYNEENAILVSYGLLDNINKSQLLFSCNIHSKLNGFPIFNLSNNKLIGIYRNIPKNNKGIFLSDLVKEFINRYNANNEIDITINILKHQINKKIFIFKNLNFFLFEYKDRYNLDNYFESLKEFNESNTELYINNKKYKFKYYFQPEKEGEYKIKMKFNFNIINCSHMFIGNENIVDINFISFNTKNIRNMECMFYKCRNLKSINLFCFDTKNVKNMSHMFHECHHLKHIDLSSFNTENVNNMSYMFYQCRELKNLDLSHFNTQNVSDMCWMFFECKKLQNIDVSSFNTENVTNMSYMFSYCYCLQKLDLSSFDTRNVTKVERIMTQCNKYIVLSNAPYFKQFNIYYLTH